MTVKKRGLTAVNKHKTLRPPTRFKLTPGKRKWIHTLPIGDSETPNLRFN